MHPFDATSPKKTIHYVMTVKSASLLERSCANWIRSGYASAGTIVALKSFREIELGLGAFKSEGRVVGGKGCCFGPVESAEPHPSCFVQAPYLTSPFASWS
ncbi:hypothetical protein NL676_038113 [Syzygium grande]|nr:hypothetical protein NL676_038113 [Syzygium grande]